MLYAPPTRRGYVCIHRCRDCVSNAPSPPERSRVGLAGEAAHAQHIYTRGIYARHLHVRCAEDTGAADLFVFCLIKQGAGGSCMYTGTSLASSCAGKLSKQVCSYLHGKPLSPRVPLFGIYLGIYVVDRYVDGLAWPDRSKTERTNDAAATRRRR